MRRLLLILLAGISIFSLSISPLSAAPREKTLKIYNWADYLDSELLDEFVEWYREQTGEDISIVYQTFDLNEVALAKVDRAKADYDLVCPSDYIVERMLKRGLLLPIDKDFGSTPNYIDNVSPFIAEKFSVISTPAYNVEDYSVPYMWITAGLLYNPAAVTREEASSWGILWDARFKNRILMKDDSRHIYGIVRAYANREAIVAGAPIAEIANDCSSEAISQVEKDLILVRQNIAGFEMDFGKELMTKGKADISVQYIGDAYWARNEAATIGVELDFVTPKEGSILCIDAWVIPKYAQNVKAASYFINFMCRPDNAARNMDCVGYSVAVAAPEILDLVRDDSFDSYSDLSYFFGADADSVRCDPLIFPNRSDVERCVVMRDFDNKTEDIMVMWATIKGDNLSLEMILVIIITALLFTIAQLRKLLKQHRRRLSRK